MTVRELREALASQNPDAEVFAYDGIEETDHRITDIETLGPHGRDYGVRGDSALDGWLKNNPNEPVVLLW